MPSKGKEKRRPRSFHLSDREAEAVKELLRKLREKEIKHGNAKY